MNLIKIGTFKSIIVAERRTGVCARTISSNCNNKRQSAGGYIWTFKNKQPLKREHKGKRVIQIDKLTGDIIQEFCSAQEAGRITNSNGSKISMVCRGERKSASGYFWKYSINF